MCVCAEADASERDNDAIAKGASRRRKGVAGV